MAWPARATFRSLASVNYRLWAIGAFISNIGTWVQRTAQDWLVLTGLTHHSAAAVGTVMALQFAPQLLFLPWTGACADRFNQRRLLMVTQVGMGLLALALGLLTVAGLVRLWQVYVFAFLFGTVAAFDAPARQTFVAELVEDAHLTNAIALNSTSFNGARMIGPALAGLIIAAVGSGYAFVLNGLSFFAVLASLLALRVHLLRPHPRAARARGNFQQGLRYVARRPDLMAMLGMLAIIGTFGLNFPIFITTMAVQVFHTGAGGYGVLSSSLALGTVSGALFAAGTTRLTYRPLFVGTALFGLGCALAALAPSYALFALALVLTGFAALLFLSISNSLMQVSTDPAMRGRVMALRISIALGGTPVGAPIVGYVADAWGPRAALGFGAASGIGACLLGLLYLARRSPPPTFG